MGVLAVLLIVIVVIVIGGLAVILFLGALTVPGDSAGGLAILGVLLLALGIVFTRALLGMAAFDSSRRKPGAPPDRSPPPDEPIPPA